MPSYVFCLNADDERLLLETRVQHNEIHNIDAKLVYFIFSKFVDNNTYICNDIKP